MRLFSENVERNAVSFFFSFFFNFWLSEWKAMDFIFEKGRLATVRLRPIRSTRSAGKKNDSLVSFFFSFFAGWDGEEQRLRRQVERLQRENEALKRRLSLLALGVQSATP